MSKVEIYEQCKVALHELNTRPLDLDEYPEEVNAVLRKIGARTAGGVLREVPKRALPSLFAFLTTISLMRNTKLLSNVGRSAPRSVRTWL